MASNKVLEIVIKAKDEASKVIAGAANTIKNKVDDMQPTFKKMAAVGTVAFVGIAAAVKSSTAAFAEAERAERQLYNAVVNVSKGTKEQVKAIDDITKALQKKAGVDGDALKMGAAQLSTFGLQSDSVVKLTKSLADLTVNQNGLGASADQYITSANVMAKALNGQFGALEKSGIRFTEAQQNLILYGTEAEKVAALQEGLNQNLRETTDTVGGVDLASAKLKQTFGDIQENIGAAMVPALAKLSEAILPLLERFASWAEANPELLSKIILIGGAVAALTAGLGALGLVLPTIIAGFTLLAGPVGIIIGIIGTLTWAVTNVVKIFQLLRDEGNLVWNGLKLTVKGAIDSIISYFEPLFSAIDKVKSAMSAIGGFVKDSVKSVVSKVTGKKAKGGSVQTGSSYLVGEEGPELFSPASNGSIIPNGKLAGAGGMSLVINMNGGTYLDPGVAEDIGDMIIQRFKQIARF